MQRCPYIHEMRERLLGQPQESLAMDSMERDGLIDNRQSSDSNQVGTVVKLHADGYHTSPAHQRTPLVPRDLGEDFNLDFDDEPPIDPRKPKNANSKNLCSLEEISATQIHSTKELDNVAPPKRTSLFIVTSLVYAMILIVVCIAYVISDVTTHRLPVLYYEGFFTYLYGASILFLLYVFCFLLQESTCCSSAPKQPKPPKEKKPKKEKPKKSKKSDPADPSKETSAAPAGTGGGGGGKGSKDSGKGSATSGKPSPFQEKFPKKKRDLVREKLLQDTPADVEAATTPKTVRKRKTTHSDQTHGSFFLRVGAIAFGLGAMIYIGLEFGSFFEIPFTSPCHHILSGVNPLLQMIFTFMQMYFIFMNARLNIHRFKVLARFGLMHVVATNICVWIRTLVKESLHEITIYHQRRGPTPEDSFILESIRRHTLRHAGTVLRTHIGPNSEFEILESETFDNSQYPSKDGQNMLSKIVKATSDGISNALGNNREEMETTSSNFHPVQSIFNAFTTTTGAPTTTLSTTTTTDDPTSSTLYSPGSTAVLKKLRKYITSTASTLASTTTTSTTPSTSTITTTTTSTESPTSLFQTFHNNPTTSTLSSSLPTSSFASIFSAFTSPTPSPASSTPQDNFILNNLFNPVENSFQTFSGASHDEVNALESYENLDNIYPAALSSAIGTINSTACGRVDIMGTIVYDSAPYLYPFIIEYSLIGAVVLYVMWKHIGRYPKHLNEEDLEHRLEVMLSRRAVAMAQQAARSGRVDCVGSSKGLFFGLLLLVGSLICLILFFVLVRHPQFSLLAIYLADVSHCALMGFAILAILIGFCRVKCLKFRCEEQSNLNDILLRISAFGLFVYSVFSVIAGSLKVLESEPNLLVTVTGTVAVLQVVLQLLFIADVSRRRVHLPEHDRSKPGRQIVTFLLICNVSMFAIYTFEAQKVFANPVQLDFYGFIPWSIIQRVTLPLCIFHRFHSAVTLAEIWKTTYKARLE